MQIHVKRLADPVWLGGIFLRDEGGYKIVIKALNHYKKRLKTLGQSPELQNSAAMFASVLHQEATKTVPKIDKTIEDIHNSLSNPEQLQSLQSKVSFLEKALSCYQSDIQKAQDTGNKYFLMLVGDLAAASNDVKPLKAAKSKLRQNSY